MKRALTGILIGIVVLSMPLTAQEPSVAEAKQRAMEQSVESLKAEIAALKKEAAKEETLERTIEAYTGVMTNAEKIGKATCKAAGGYLDTIEFTLDGKGTPVVKCQYPRTVSK